MFTEDIVMVAETNQRPLMDDRQEGGMNPGLITVAGFVTLAAVLLAFGALVRGPNTSRP